MQPTHGHFPPYNPSRPERARPIVYRAKHPRGMPLIKIHSPLCTSPLSSFPLSPATMQPLVAKDFKIFLARKASFIVIFLDKHCQTAKLGVIVTCRPAQTGYKSWTMPCGSPFFRTKFITDFIRLNPLLFTLHK